MLWKTNSLAGIFKKESSGGLSARIDYWKGTWKMIDQYPLLGVGPGNFGNSYARFMNENALEKIKAGLADALGNRQQADELLAAWQYYC